MDSLNLSVHKVPCIGEVDFNDLKRSTSVEIILVDHNNIFDKSLEPECLIEVIDHHEYKTQFGRNVKLTIDTVGSCSSLVMQRIWEQEPNFQDYHSYMLCRYAIITDTVNFSDIAKKTTETDIHVISQLESYLKIGTEKRNLAYQ